MNIIEIEKNMRSRFIYINGYWKYVYKNGSDISILGRKNSNPVKLLKSFHEDYIRAVKEFCE